MKVKHHMQLNIEGALKNASKKQLAHMFTDEDGNNLTAQEAKAYLELCRFEGKKFLPMGDCEGFDYQKGCPGHPISDESN